MKVMLLSLVFVAVAALAQPSFGAEPAGRSEPGVKYGDYCIGPYGSMQRQYKLLEAVEALRRHFVKQGLRAEVLGHDRRFIRADVYREDRLVDSIVLDAKTGKMRSVY